MSTRALTRVGRTLVAMLTLTVIIHGEGRAQPASAGRLADAPPGPAIAQVQVVR